MMRGMPKCSKHEWRYKKRGEGAWGRKNKSVGFCLDFGFSTLGLPSTGGLLFGGLLSLFPARYIQREKKSLIVYLDKKPELSSSSAGPVSPRSFSPCMIIASVLFSLIRKQNF